MAAETAPVPAGPESSTEDPAPPPSRPERRGRWTVVGAVVVAGLVVAALFAFGVLHFGASGSSSEYLTFSGAQSSAQGASNSVAGGPWFVSLVLSLVTPTAILEPVTNVSSFLTDASCTYDWIHGEPANLAVPSTPASAGLGASAFWVVGLKNASNGLLLETISDANAQALVTIEGHNCSDATAYLVQFPPETVNSPTVLSSVNAAGGSAFLAAHRNATELWAGIGGVGEFGVETTPEWFVEYTSCSFPAIAGESGAYFDANVSGLTGEVTSNHTGTTACTLGIPVSVGSIDSAPNGAFALGKAI
jgi:hypothetical protein